MPQTDDALKAARELCRNLEYSPSMEEDVKIVTDFILKREKAAVESAKPAITNTQLDPQALLHEWHQKFGVHASEFPAVPPSQVRSLRIELIREELEEFVSASVAEDVIEVADAIADMLYVVYGAAVAWGIPARECFEEVHRSNMTKIWPDGTVHRRQDGKVLKPPSYSPANLRPIIRAAIDAAMKPAEGGKDAG